jgi:hypothetical protein
MMRKAVIVKSVWLFFLLFQADHLLGQVKLSGYIKDTHSDESIPFASVQFKNTGQGKLSDSSGHFQFNLSRWPSDTIVITYAGFQDQFIRIDTSLNEVDLVVNMERGKASTEVIVRGRINRGLLLWRRIVKNKPTNDRRNFDNFSYELYNKLEIDLNKINKEKLQKGFIPPKPFKFILNNVDTSSEEHPFLPVYLTETISDYYFQSDPKKTREVIRANKTIGVKNESFSRLLGGMYQNINVYKNFIPVFDLNFVSPISDNGDNYYNYKVPDTQFIAGKRYFHLVFYPKRKGGNTFQGDAWIADSTYAVQKMNLRLSPGANVNFVEKLSLVQEYELVGDSVWVLAKDKFIVDFALKAVPTLYFIGRKTTTYKKVIINDSSVTKVLATDRLKETIEMNNSAMEQPDSFWQNNRHEALSANEEKFYAIADTLLRMPAFEKFKETINFLGTGYKNIGNYQIGPWFNWVSGNIYEGMRVRFDVGTNRHFSKKIYFSTYLAYGFKDQKFKGKFETLYLLKKKPRSHIYAMYKNDMDYGQTYYDEIAYDNIFALAFRKTQVPIKLIKIEQVQLEYFKEWKNGFSVTLTGHRKLFDPIINLPDKEAYYDPKNKGETFNNFEVSVKLRFAYLEQHLENTFFRSSLGSDYPITEIRLARGIPGILNSSYKYTKLNVSVSDFQKLPPFGSIYYNVYAGKVFGTLPYMLLSIAPGNEIYYYNKYAFNLMNRYEYLMDRYAGATIEHNIGSGIFRYMPFNKFLKWRQFWNAKLLWGDLSEANKTLNFQNGHPFKSLDGKPYLEIGTGIDNILRFLRLDLVWRVLPQPLPEARYQRFGIFGSFRVSF